MLCTNYINVLDIYTISILSLAYYTSLEAETLIFSSCKSFFRSMSPTLLVKTFLSWFSLYYNSFC